VLVVVRSTEYFVQYIAIGSECPEQMSSTRGRFDNTIWSNNYTSIDAITLSNAAERRCQMPRCLTKDARILLRSSK
jgi:hypothetical protein